MDNICLTAFLQGYGFLFQHRLDKVHMMFHRNVIGMVDEIRASRCGMALLEITKSLNSGSSPAILPRAHIASSHTVILGKTGAQPRAGCPPLLMTTSVFSSLKPLHPLMYALSQLKVSFPLIEKSRRGFFTCSHFYIYHLPAFEPLYIHCLLSHCFG